MAKTLHLAKVIITNDKSPIFNAGLLLDGSRIISVEKKEDFGNLGNGPAEIVDHGEALLCPGFINLHTHLLYSSLGHIDCKDGLFPWLEKLIDKIFILTKDDLVSSINYGIEQILGSGTTFIVENTPQVELVAKELSKTQLKALIGLEIFSSEEEKADETFNMALSNFNTQYSILNPNIDFTFSPHAPYDVSKPLWKKLVEWSENNNKLLLTHLEESPQEKLWWKEKSGPALTFWKKINKLEPKLKYWQKYSSGIDFLNKNQLLNKNIIATHLSQCTKDDLNTLQKTNVKLVHCPRSNFYLNNGTVNLELWNNVGLKWGIGTDSLASNHSLDLLEEIKFTINQQKIAHNFHVPAELGFKSITSSAAEVLGKETEIGSLKKGSFADFLIFDISKKPACTYHDPYHLIVFEVNTKKDLRKVFINGKNVWLSRATLNKI